MSDIVKRLRDFALVEDDDPPPSLLLKAADRITELEAEVERRDDMINATDPTIKAQGHRILELKDRIAELEAALEKKIDVVALDIAIYTALPEYLISMPKAMQIRQAIITQLGLDVLKEEDA